MSLVCLFKAELQFACVNTARFANLHAYVTAQSKIGYSYGYKSAKASFTQIGRCKWDKDSYDLVHIIYTVYWIHS